MKRYVLAALLAAAFPTCAHAAEACDQPQTGFDNVYCFARVFMDLDRQLNENYRALMGRLDATQKEILRDGQREWITLRDGQCYRQEGHGDLVDIRCALDVTRQRIQFLSDRLAECRANGCNIRKLGLATES